MRALYTLSILLYRVAIGIAAWFVPKARLWVNGRRNWQQQLAQKLAGSNAPVIWMHCASLGEFEQGRPILEALRQAKPGHRLLLTFFSPSGYEVRKNYTGADIICYLPADTPANARRFAELVKPEAAIFIKYEFWLNLLSQLRRNNVPHILVAGIFRPSQTFFKPWGGIFRTALHGFAHLFVQDEQSETLLRGIGITKLSRGGDPRFDRVAQIAAQPRSIPIAEAFAQDNRPILVAGSTWPADEQLLIPALAKHFGRQWKLLIAPHELGEAHLQHIESLLQKAGLSPQAIVRFSAATTETAAQAQALLIDNIGMLSALYGFGRAAYIGGGFGKSIHNTLEAAVWGIPVVFGPKHKKFNEALGLLACGGGFAVHDENSLSNTIDQLLQNPAAAAEAGKKAGEYVQQNRGATQLALSFLNTLGD